MLLLGLARSPQAEHITPSAAANNTAATSTPIARVVEQQTKNALSQAQPISPTPIAASNPIEERPAAAVAATSPIKPPVVKMPTRLATTSISKPMSLDSREQEAIKAVELDLPSLEKHWNEAINSMPQAKEYETLFEGCTLKLLDQNNFSIVTRNVFFEAKFSSVKAAVISYMRKHTGHVQLNCNVEVILEKVERKAYSPNEKYEAMLRENSQIGVFRKIFSDIDF